MYPNSIAINKAVLDFFELKTELESLKSSRDDSEKNAIKTALLINNEIKDLEPQMSRPPKEDVFKPRTANILDVFMTVLILGNRSVTNGAVKTLKSVLFPSVVKAP